MEDSTMDGQHIKVITRIVAQEDNAEEVEAVLRDLVEPTRAEPGCIHYELLRNITDATDLTYIQEWESKEAFERHLDTDHTKGVARKLTQLVKMMPDIRRYTTIA